MFEFCIIGDNENWLNVQQKQSREVCFGRYGLHFGPDPVAWLELLLIMADPEFVLLSAPTLREKNNVVYTQIRTNKRVSHPIE